MPPVSSARRCSSRRIGPVPRGYANGMMAHGRLIVTGGVVGWDTQGTFAEGFIPQVRLTLGEYRGNPRGRRRRARQHLVRLTWYVTDLGAYKSGPARISGRAYRDVIGAHYPAMGRWSRWPGLVEDAALVEIEGDGGSGGVRLPPPHVTRLSLPLPYQARPDRAHAKPAGP